MPFAVIAVSMLFALAVTTPSEASPSCMSKAEARQHFGSVHIYWHGRNRCWDAAPTRRLTQTDNGQRNRRTHEARRNIDRPKWRESMSEMLSDDKPAQTTSPTPWINRWTDIEPTILTLDARWVDIAQTRLPSIIERPTEPRLSSRVVLLACITIAIGLTLAIIEFLFRRTVY